MKSTGIVRKVDDLGRVVLPIELRRTLNINQGDAMEIYTESNQIILRKYTPGCVLCGSMDDLVTNHPSGKLVCKKCLGV